MKATPFMGERHDIVGVAPGDPPAHTSLVWGVPDNAVVQIVALEIQLQTTATAGDRHVSVYVSDGGLFIPRTPAAIVQPATKVWTYFFTIGIAPLDLTAFFGQVFQPFGCCYQLETGSFLIVEVNNMDGSDQLSLAKIRYFHWERG